MYYSLVCNSSVNLPRPSQLLVWTAARFDTATYGDSAVDSAQLIFAWSRVSGIGQLQTFGTPLIGFYRELRRLRTPKLPLYEGAG